MKKVIAICVLVTGLVLGDALDGLNVVTTKCQQCLDLLSFMRATSDWNPTIIENHEFCKSECNQLNGLENVLNVTSKDCETCKNAVNKINKYYNGNDAWYLIGALAHACSMFDFKCKAFISYNHEKLVHMLQSTKDAYRVCSGVQQC